VVPYMADHPCTFKPRVDGGGVVVTIPKGPLGTPIVRDIDWGEEIWCSIGNSRDPILQGQIKFQSWDDGAVKMEVKQYDMKEILDSQHPVPELVRITNKDRLSGLMHTLLTPITHFLTLAGEDSNVHNLFQLLSRNNFYCSMYNMEYVPPMKIYGFANAVANAIAFPSAQQQVREKAACCF
jgi:hypothetical protein